VRVTDEHGVKERRGCGCVDIGELRICGADERVPTFKSQGKVERRGLRMTPPAAASRPLCVAALLPRFGPARPESTWDSTIPSQKTQQQQVSGQGKIGAGEGLGRVCCVDIGELRICGPGKRV
jgi:hypothetical protein